MAGYEITAPDGSVFEVTAPEGATEQQILEYAKANMPQAPGYGDPTLSERVGGGIMGISQGASYGFGDELAAGLTAAGASALDALQLDRLMTGKEYDKSFSQTYEDDLARSRKRMAQAAEQTPIEYYGGQVVGGVATGLGGAATAPGQVVTRAVTQGSLPSRIVSGGLSGAVSGATYGFGTGEGGFDERTKSAQQGSIYGGVGGAAVPAAGAAIKSATKGVKNIITGSTARGVEQLDEALGAIRKQASQAYNKMREAGAVIKNKDARVIAQSLDDAMKEAGPSIRELHRPTIAILDSIKKATKKGNIGLDEVDKYRSVLGRIAANKMDGENSFRATRMLQALDDSLESLGENSFIAGNRSALDALKVGRREYSRAKKFELIANIIKKSDGDANYLKRELKKVLDNPKKLRGFNQSEIRALKEASKLSFGEGTMKMLGKFGFDLGSSRIGNTALPVIGAGASYAAGSGGLAAVVPTIGTAARYGQKALARGKAENLLKAIEGTAQRQGRTAFSNPAISGAVSRPAANASKSPGILRQMINNKSGSVGQPAAIMGGAAGLAATGTPENAEAGVFEDFDQYQRERDLPPIPEYIPDQSILRNTQGSLLDRIAMAESSGNPNAKARTSSASGLFQFTDRTWRNMVKKYGKEAGIKRNDKDNPEAQRVMAELLLQENADILGKKLQREPSDADLYAAHVLGPNYAAKLINAMQQQDPPAIRVVPREFAQANRSIFYDGNRPKRASEVYELLASKVA